MTTVRMMCSWTAVIIVACGCGRVDDSTEANKDVVRRFLAVTDGRQFDQYAEFLSPDVVAHFPGGVDLNRAAVEDAESAFAVGFPDVVRTVEDLFAAGDLVVVRTAIRGTHRGDFQGIAPTQRPIAVTAIVIYRVVDGLIAESWVEADFLGLMTQLGAV